MKFQAEFFKEEVREGFYIEPMMKCAWAVQMDILEDIQKVCRENSIQYFADGGTLLGAVRHQGYIPWDDDIDIAMLRPDYDRFLEIIKKVWKDKYTLKIPGETEHYNMSFTKVNNADHVSFDAEDLYKFHGFPYITGIDIFPLDIIPDDDNERNTLLDLYLILINASEIDKLGDSPDEIEENLQSIEEMCRCKIDRNGDIQKQLCRIAELICKLYQGTDNSDLTMLCYCNRNVILKKEWYEEIEWKKFETMVLPVPKHYHEVLTAWYGDYLTPVQGVAAHDYPFYKKQMEIVEQKLAQQVYGIGGSNMNMGSK